MESARRHRWIRTVPLKIKTRILAIDAEWMVSIISLSHPKNKNATINEWMELRFIRAVACLNNLRS